MVKENVRLYLTLAAVCIYSVSVQVWMPYILIYLEHYLGFNVENLTQYLTGPVLIAAPFALAAAVAVVILGGKLIDKVGKNVLIFVAFGLFAAGCFGAFFARSLAPFGLAAIPLLTGYGFLGIMLNATVRDHTPEDKVGLFQGVRMIFFVLIPMVVGPHIGDLACKLSRSGQYMDETGNLTYEPAPAMFLAAGIVILFTLIPLIALRKKGFAAKPQD